MNTSNTLSFVAVGLSLLALVVSLTSHRRQDLTVRSVEFEATESSAQGGIVAGPSGGVNLSFWSSDRRFQSAMHAIAGYSGVVTTEGESTASLGVGGNLKSLGVEGGSKSMAIVIASYGTAMAGLFAGPDSRPSLKIRSESSQTRLVAGVLPDGSVNVLLYDEHGKLVWSALPEK